MTDGLYRLLYYSRQRSEEDHRSLRREVVALLANSQAYDCAAGITGVLMANATGFAQVLEGPRRALETAFERTQRDARHGDLWIMVFEPIEERAFNTTPTTIVNDERLEMEYLEKAPNDAFSQAEVSADRLFDILRQLTASQDPAQTPLAATG